MNQKLTDKLDKLPAALETAKTTEDVTTAVVEIERLVLQSNYEDSRSGSPEESYIAQDYVVGERNTRGLSWKLNLLRSIAAANFCRLVRVGVHGGQTRILGQQSNIDVTLRIYDALVATYTRLSTAAFTDFSDGHKSAEGAPTVHKAGWINQFLIEAPNELMADVVASREKDAGANSKVATMIAERTAKLQEFATSLAPAKPEKAPKAEKAPKSPKAGKTTASNGNAEAETSSASVDENTGESAGVGNTVAEPEMVEAAQ